MLIGYAGLGGSQLNTLLSTGIHILYHFTVSCGQFIEFVYPVLDALNVLLYVLLAGKRVQDEPPQSGLIAVPEVVVGTSRVGLLRKRGKRKYRGQDQRYGYAILHMIFLPEAPLQPDSDKYLEPGNQVLFLATFTMPNRSEEHTSE